MNTAKNSIESKRFQVIFGGLVALLAPGVAFADDLSGLVFVVFIWPMAAVLALLMFIFLVLCIVQLARGVRGKTAGSTGKWSIIVSIGSWVIFTLWTLFWVGSEADRHFEMGLVHIMLFVVLILPSLILGIVLRRRGSQ